MLSVRMSRILDTEKIDTVSSRQNIAAEKNSRSGYSGRHFRLQRIDKKVRENRSETIAHGNTNNLP